MKNRKLESLKAALVEAQKALAFAEDNLDGYAVRSALVSYEFAFDDYHDYLKKVNN